MSERKIPSFKKFSDLKKSNKEMEEIQPGLEPENDSDRPMLPNLPNTDQKVQKVI